jgi:hypothetical protein
VGESQAKDGTLFATRQSDMSQSESCAQEISVSTWDEFEEQLQWLESFKRSTEKDVARAYDAPLFRGIGNATWKLQTSLERAFPLEDSSDSISFLEYYRRTIAAKPAIESLTGALWKDVPDYPEMKERLRRDKTGWIDTCLLRENGVYRYWIYLRHHGFPSPLLDWTASPYLAALFAFDQTPHDAKHACIYAYLRDGLHCFSSELHAFVVGPYVQTDKRHFLQQSRYSMCVSTSKDDYLFQTHDPGLVEEGGKNGFLFKLLIPTNARLEFLKRLDLMNINPYSLYASEDSLIRTIARRECLFK